MSSDRLSLYREAIELESEREKIQSDLERVSMRLTAIHDQISSGTDPVRLSSATGSPVFIGVPQKRKARAGRGKLKAQILQILEEAGTAGIGVQEIAKSVGSKSANIHAWFQNAAKRIPQIKKAGRGVYRIEGSASAKVAPAPISKPVKTKAAGKRGKRGALSAQIQDLIKTAGSAGMSMKDIATKTGVKYGNISVWFSTTGKKIKALKKVGPGHYRMA